MIYASFWFLMVRHPILKELTDLRHVFIETKMMPFPRCGKEAWRCTQKNKNKNVITMSIFNLIGMMQLVPKLREGFSVGFEIEWENREGSNKKISKAMAFVLLHEVIIHM